MFRTFLKLAYVLGWTLSLSLAFIAYSPASLAQAAQPSQSSSPATQASTGLPIASSPSGQSTCLPNGKNLHGYDCIIGYGSDEHDYQGDYDFGGYGSSLPNPPLQPSTCYDLNGNFRNNGNSGAPTSQTYSDEVEPQYYAPDGDNDADDVNCTAVSTYNGYAMPAYNASSQPYNFSLPFYFNNNPANYQYQYGPVTR